MECLNRQVGLWIHSRQRPSRIYGTQTYGTSATCQTARRRSGEVAVAGAQEEYPDADCHRKLESDLD